MTLRDSVADISVPLDRPARPGRRARHAAGGGRERRRPGQAVLLRQPRLLLAGASGEIRMVGLGELLARLEQRRQLLAAEGLFARELKRSLPVPAPAGRAGHRPGVRRRAGRRSTTPGGGGPASPSRSPTPRCRASARPARSWRRSAGSTATRTSTSSWSRAAAARWRTCCRSPTRAWCAPCSRLRTPVVSAIGHEQDQPLLDLVADVRASTPTDAAKLVVPDVAEELAARGHGPPPAAARARRLAVARAGRARRAALPAGARRPAQSCSTSGADEVATCSPARGAPWATGSTGPRTTSPTSAPGPGPSPRWPRWNAATPSSRTPTGTSSPRSPAWPRRPRSACAWPTAASTQ